MNRKRIEDKFSIEMDAYFNGIEANTTPKPQEYNELLELGKILADKDFSKDSNKKAVLNKAFKNINEHRGDNTMKNSNKTRKFAIKVASIATICVMSVAFIKPAFAQNLAEKIIKTISLGHISAVQTEPSKIEKAAVPDNLKGKIFDKNGKPIVEFSRSNPQKLYTSSGEEIVSISNGKPITAAEEEKDEKEQLLEVKDPSEINKHTCFKVVLPSYLPEGYKFDKAEVYKDKDESNVVNSKYVDLYFASMKSGKKIFMQQRFADEETGYVSGTDGNIEKVKVNGADAIITDDKSIDWEANNVIYMMSSKGTFHKSELIKIAESIK